MRHLYLTLVSMLAILIAGCTSPYDPIDDTPSDDPTENQDPYAEVIPGNPENSEDPQNPNPGSGTTDDVIEYSLVEVRPTFQGGDANKFYEWVQKNLVYPEQAKAEGVQGRVNVQFIVNTNGSMSNVEVKRGVDDRLNAEAVRVIQSCQIKWTPGMQNGKKVRVRVGMTVPFQIYS